jgi:hypothetical protein
VATEIVFEPSDNLSTISLTNVFTTPEEGTFSSMTLAAHNFAL